MRKTTKLVATIGTSALVLGTAGVAYAYWTTTGSGAGDAVAGTSNGTITLTAAIPSGLVPGGSKTVTISAANPGSTDLRVRTVHLDSVSVVNAPTVTGTCNTADITMPDVAANQTVPNGTTLASPLALTQTGTVSFANDLVASQDACKGATFTLHLSSN